MTTAAGSFPAAVLFVLLSGVEAGKKSFHPLFSSFDCAQDDLRYKITYRSQRRHDAARV